MFSKSGRLLSGSTATELALPLSSLSRAFKAGNLKFVFEALVSFTEASAVRSVPAAPPPKILILEIVAYNQRFFDLYMR